MLKDSLDIYGDDLHEECGVFGIFGVDDAPNLAYYGLHALQHRGQEACGISAFDGEKLNTVKGEGLVTEVFNQQKLDKLKGRIAIGHVRYATTGGEDYELLLTIDKESFNNIANSLKKDILA